MSAHQRTKGPDCAGCHMPKATAYDGGHTAFHDHWIRRGRDEQPSRNTGRLRAWREIDPSSRRRNLGLAYISVGSKIGDTNQLLRGFELLDGNQADDAVQTARGLVWLRAGKTREAVEAFRKAANAQPADSTRRLNLATALFAAGDRVEAKREAEHAIGLEPLLQDAYALLAEIEPEHAQDWRRRYSKLLSQRRAE